MKLYKKMKSSLKLIQYIVPYLYGPFYSVLVKNMAANLHSEKESVFIVI